MERNKSSSTEARFAIATEALRKADEKATAGQLALEMIHEIKNPLEALGHLTYLASEEAENPACVRKYLLLAHEQMEQLRQIAQQTLGFARTPRSPRPTQGVTLAEAALRIHQRAIDTKKIHLVTQLPPDVSADVWPGELLQVLSNIIDNAVGALPPSGTLRLRIRKAGGKMHILIADNGHGIAAEHRHKLFQPFFTTKQDQGNGLGLALSKKIVERHGGSIRVRSSTRPGRSGTTFRISLPAIADDPAESTATPARG